MKPDAVLETGRSESLRIATVLAAEDDPDDAFLLKRAFKKAGLTHNLVQLPDGEQAIRYLSGTAPFSDRRRNPLPELFLLDLKMPLMSGFEVLEWLQDQPELRRMPVVVLSSSAQEVDMRRAHALGAADFFCKPKDPAELVRIVKRIDERWLGAHRLAFPDPLRSSRCNPAATQGNGARLA